MPQIIPATTMRTAAGKLTVDAFMLNSRVLSVVHGGHSPFVGDGYELRMSRAMMICFACAG
jgi:hypothetical protein